MAHKAKAAAAGTAHGLDGMGSAGTVDYCPPERKLRQRDKLLGYLNRYGSITTQEARSILRIMHPAGRIAELRHLGYVIPEFFDKQQQCGRYVLQTSDGED